MWNNLNYHKLLGVIYNGTIMSRDRWQFLKIFKCYTVLGLASQTFIYLLPVPGFSEINSIWKMGGGGGGVWNTHTHTHFIPGHLLKRNKSICTHTRPCNTNVIKALSLITKNWTQPKCPSIGEWIVIYLYNTTVLDNKKKWNY